MFDGITITRALKAQRTRPSHRDPHCRHGGRGACVPRRPSEPWYMDLAHLTPLEETKPPNLGESLTGWTKWFPRCVESQRTGSCTCFFLAHVRSRGFWDAWFSAVGPFGQLACYVLLRAKRSVTDGHCNVSTQESDRLFFASSTTSGAVGCYRAPTFSLLSFDCLVRGLKCFVFIKICNCTSVSTTSFQDVSVRSRLPFPGNSSLSR